MTPWDTILTNRIYIWDVGGFDLFLVSSSILCDYQQIYHNGRERKNKNKPEKPGVLYQAFHISKSFTKAGVTCECEKQGIEELHVLVKDIKKQIYE